MPSPEFPDSPEFEIPKRKRKAKKQPSSVASGGTLLAEIPGDIQNQVCQIARECADRSVRGRHNRQV